MNDRHPDFDQIVQDRNNLFSKSLPSLHRRPLSSNEVHVLQHHARCVSDDWSQVYVTTPQNCAQLLQTMISDCLLNHVELRLTAPPLSSSAPTLSQRQHQPHQAPTQSHCALWRSSVTNSIVCLGEGTRIHNSTVHDTFIDGHVTISNVGLLHCENAPLLKRFNVSVGPESGGGRPLQLPFESTMIQVGQQILVSSPESPTVGQDETNTQQERQSMSIIGSHSVIENTAKVNAVILHNHATIDGATSVSQTVLFPHSRIYHNSIVSNSVLQWDSSVQSSSLQTVFVMEHACVGPHGLVHASVLGPDVHVSAGEVHASVLGPNVNAHHQSLLISVLWPTGRGNVGYGANVGSNHTSRLPDQECTCGEGVFWGLSSVIKFPVDLSFAVYSVVAAGTTVAPQRVTMPFSLLVNETIVPGWVLRSSLYSIVRNETKFAQRRQAQRHAFYTGWKILRPQTMELCRIARHQLQQQQNEVLGIGSCQLSTKARASGIQAYRFILEWYALRGLYDRLVSNHGTIQEVARDLAQATPLDAPVALVPVEWPMFPWDDTRDVWRYQKQLLLSEFGDSIASKRIDTDTVRTLLERFVSKQQQFFESVHRCKQRDDTRGMDTIPGYRASHVLVEDDPVVVALQTECHDIETTIARMCGIQCKL